jgi:predicted nucleic acid-binding protein
VRVVVDTGVLSASLSRRRRPRFETQIGLMAGHQIFLAAVTVSELRYCAFVAGWGEAHPLHDRAQPNDLWIAASALHLGAPLLTADNVFSNTPGLTFNQ